MQSKKMICPHSQKECVKDGTIVMVNGNPELHACPAWVMVQGVDPQTGADINSWNCSQFHWMPFLTIENSKMQRETGAAVESFRNEMVKANNSAHILMLASHGMVPEQMLKQIAQAAIVNNSLENRG